MYQLQTFQSNIFDAIISFILAFTFQWSSKLPKYIPDNFSVPKAVTDVTTIFIYLISIMNLLKKIPNAQRLRELKTINYVEYDSVRRFFIGFGCFVSYSASIIFLFVENSAANYLALWCVAIVQIKLSAITTETDCYSWRILDNSDSFLILIGVSIAFFDNLFLSFNSTKIVLALYILRSIFYIYKIGINNKFNSIPPTHIYKFYKTQAGRTGKIFWNLISKLIMAQTLVNIGMIDALIKVVAITNITNVLSSVFSNWQKQAFVNMSLITKKENNINIIRYTLEQFFTNNFRTITQTSTVILPILMKLAIVYGGIEIANFSWIEVSLILFLEHIYVVFDVSSDVCGKLISYYIEPKFDLPNIISKQIPYIMSFFFTLLVHEFITPLSFVCKESKFLIFIFFKLLIKILELITTFWVIPSLCSLEYVFERLKTNLTKGFQNGLKIYQPLVSYIGEMIRTPFIVLLAISFILTGFGSFLFNPFSEQLIYLFQYEPQQLMKIFPFKLLPTFHNITETTVFYTNFMYLILFLSKLIKETNLNFFIFRISHSKNFIIDISKYVLFASAAPLLMVLMHAVFTGNIYYDRLVYYHLVNCIDMKNQIDLILIKQSYYCMTMLQFVFKGNILTLIYYINIILMSIYLLKNYISSINKTKETNPYIQKSLGLLQKFCNLSNLSADNEILQEQYYLTSHKPYTSEDLETYLENN